MESVGETYYRALCSRDKRFDGRFFTGVLTTGIFCRPICPARTPIWPAAQKWRAYAAIHLWTGTT